MTCQARQGRIVGISGKGDVTQLSLATGGPCAVRYTQPRAGEAKLQRGSAFSSQQGDWVLDRSGERGRGLSVPPARLPLFTLLLRPR